MVFNRTRSQKEDKNPNKLHPHQLQWALITIIEIRAWNAI